MYKEGLSVETIAEKRELKPTTIFSHLAKLYAAGEDVDIYDFITKQEVDTIRKAKKDLGAPNALKPYFDYFNEQMGYDKIRLALSILERE